MSTVSHGSTGRTLNVLKILADAVLNQERESFQVWLRVVKRTLCERSQRAGIRVRIGSRFLPEDYLLQCPLRVERSIRGSFIEQIWCTSTSDSQREGALLPKP